MICQLTIKVFFITVLLINLNLTSVQANQACDQKDSHQSQQCDIKQAKQVEQNDSKQTTTNSCVKVASLESTNADGSNCRESANKNLATIQQAAKIAQEQGVKILVTPEDGIIYDVASLADCLEEIPNPDVLEAGQNDNPCLQAKQYAKSMPILSKLSCIARGSKLYLIANFGTKQTCSAGEQVNDTTCPSSGYLMLNTDVVFDPEGRFIRRYRKYNPFVITELFDKAPSPEHIYFDTPYGRFGLFTCFDLLFKVPAIDLVEKYAIDTVIFPTWWFDEMPILTAPQIQDGWSWSNRVNLIAANILRPQLASIGSGIYSGRNIIQTGAYNKRNKLLIANVDKFNSNDCPKEKQEFSAQFINVDDKRRSDSYGHHNLILRSNDSITILNKSQDSITSCAGEVCCTLEYKADKLKAHSMDTLVMIVRDAPRVGPMPWYEQFCLVASIDGEVPSLNETTQLYHGLYFNELAGYSFDKLKMSLNTTTKYVYPFAGHDIANLVSRQQRDFGCKQQASNSNAGDIKTICEHELNSAATKVPIYSFGMYGRCYDCDVLPTKRMKPMERVYPGRAELR